MGLESYTLRDLLSVGEMTRVNLATSHKGSPVVVKKMNKKQVEEEWVQNEVKAGKLLEHPGIVQFREYFEDKDNYYVVLDYISGKDLLSFLEDREFSPLPEAVARSIFLQLLNA